MHRVIAFGFRVRLIWNASVSVLCACSPKNKLKGFWRNLPHGIMSVRSTESVSTVGVQRRFYSEAMWFLFHKGFLLTNILNCAGDLLFPHTQNTMDYNSNSQWFFSFFFYFSFFFFKFFFKFFCSTFLFFLIFSFIFVDFTF
jgi:hypothetical protein